MYPLADIAIGETENGVGIHILPSIVDLGDVGFGGLKERLNFYVTTPGNSLGCALPAS